MKSNRILLVLALFGVLALAVGCAARPAVPPITTDTAATPKPGKFVWHDLLTEKPDVTRKFYGELLGWTFEPTEIPDYSIIKSNGRAVGGIVDMRSKDPDENESQWISVLSVPDVDAATKKTRDAGGEIHVKPVDLPGRGRFALVSDPQGAVLAYIRTVDGDPADDRAAVGEFLWNELWTSDVEDAVPFYRELVGYELEDKKLLDEDYTVFVQGDTPRAGTITRPDEDVRSHWLPYVRVDDPAALQARVEDLGGQVLLEASDDIREGTVIIVLDPSGAPVALQKWEAES